jgi:predicted ribosomally synthesized peptide with SipW-like signal peptide
MSDRQFRISRRKVLAGLGTIGVASAGAGLGTTAYFSDEETFENNQLTAGALDLVVDWEEHYSDWSPDEAEGLANPVYMSDPGTDGYVPFPTPIQPAIYLHQEDVEQFMDNTSIEAYPDVDDDGVQDPLEEYLACDDFAQLDENLDPTNGRGDGKRTVNADTIRNFDAFQEGADPDVAPLVNLDDVKPGDFGELTLSMHLCDNPGYIWLQGELVSADENGYTEPEMKDPDESGDADGDGVDDRVELLDEIQTMLWYDEDGDNVFEPGASGGGDADIVIVMDTSGSMSGTKIANAKAGAKALVNAVGPDVRIGLVEFSSQEGLVQDLTTDKAALETAIDSLGTGGSTNIEGGINAAREILDPANPDVSDIDPSVLGDSSTPNITVLLSDGSPNVDDDGDGSDDPTDEATAAKAAGIEMYTIAYGVSAGDPLAQLMESLASDPKEQYAYLAADIDEVEAIFAQIGQILAGEEAFFQGTLRDLLTLVGTDRGIPLDGIRATGYTEVTGDDTDGDGFVDANYGLGDGADPAREPFVNSTTNALGLAWWLPVDHANEIQTDSVTFDLGFYTEQARHNDGSGQAPVTTPSTTNSS